ncbi:hypothetical protein ML462_13860 [Gramella lutea]|uniref:Uncharacterized protein n=1 Tax=Christiangramia lutea TaxID=1607951 RepID=A0A9X1V8A0_9FLAO|nr:hypothetical protein [Christiangramia lutea]MCH4824258.1 hypothetical protein [Christiangramia lutea]
MKKVQFFLLAFILLAIAAKVSFTPVKRVDYAVLSTETKLEHVQQFFQYKVNHIQSENPYKIKSCMIQTAVCCHS